MPSKKKRLTQAERGTYLNAARELRQAGVEIKGLEELLVSPRAVDVYLASPGGLGSMVSQSSNGGVHYVVWVRMVARHGGSLLDCRLTTRWDHNILLNSFDDRLVCKLGEVEYPQADILNQRIEESLRFCHRGDIVEGVILATGIRPIPQAFRQGMLMPFELTFEDEFENQTVVTGDLSVDRTARSKELPARCGTGLYGDSAASRRAREGLHATQQHASSIHLHRGRTHNSITLVAQTTRRCEVAWRTVADALEAWALFCRGAGRAKACARTAGPKSGALETDASGLNGSPHGAWGSPAVFVPWRSGLGERLRIFIRRPRTNGDWRRNGSPGSRFSERFGLDRQRARVWHARRSANSSAFIDLPLHRA